MQNWYGPSQILYPNVFPDINLARLALGPSTSILLSTKDLFLFGVTMPMLGALIWFVRSTRLGKAIRAVAQDREAAAMMGVNVERVIATAFFIGGALAGAAGMVVGLYLNTGRYLMGFDVGLKAFTAAVLGGSGTCRAPCWRIRHRFSRRLQRSVHLVHLDARRGLRHPHSGAGLSPVGLPRPAATGALLMRAYWQALPCNAGSISPVV